MLHHISTSDFLVAAFLTSLVIIVIIAAYLDFRPLKTFRGDSPSRPSNEDFLTRSRSRIL
jgi:hypothetical protein